MSLINSVSSNQFVSQKRLIWEIKSHYQLLSNVSGLQSKAKSAEEAGLAPSLFSINSVLDKLNSQAQKALQEVQPQLAKSYSAQWLTINTTYTDKKQTFLSPLLCFWRWVGRDEAAPSKQTITSSVSAAHTEIATRIWRLLFCLVAATAKLQLMTCIFPAPGRSSTWGTGPWLSHPSASLVQLQ